MRYRFNLENDLSGKEKNIELPQIDKLHQKVKKILGQNARKTLSCL